jgi:hypothetical protein
VAEGSNDSVNGFNAVEDGGEVKRGIKGGGRNDGEASNSSGGSEGGAGRRGVAGGDGEKRQRSVDVGKGMVLTGGPHTVVT